MSFKDKPLKKINGDNRVTIDVIHNDLIKDFNSKEEEIDELKETLIQLKEEYNDNSDERILLKMDKIKEILKNYNEDSKKNYYLDNGELLSEYYEKKTSEYKKPKNTNNLIIDLMLKKKEKLIDKEENKAQNYGIRSVPTVVIEQGGQEVDRFIGVLAKKQVIKRLSS